MQDLLYIVKLQRLSIFHLRLKYVTSSNITIIPSEKGFTYSYKSHICILLLLLPSLLLLLCVILLLQIVFLMMIFYLIMAMKTISSLINLISIENQTSFSSVFYALDKRITSQIIQIKHDTSIGLS